MQSFWLLFVNVDDALGGALPIRLHFLLSSDHQALIEKQMVTSAETHAEFEHLFEEARAVFPEDRPGGNGRREAERKDLLQKFAPAGFESLSVEKSVVQP